MRRRESSPCAAIGGLCLDSLVLPHSARATSMEKVAQAHTIEEGKDVSRQQHGRGAPASG